MKFLIALTLLALQGCMSTEVVPQGSTFSYENNLESNHASAYFYQFDMPGVNSCLLVGVEGKYKGCIGYPGYTRISITTGTKEISFTPNSPIKIANLDFDFGFEAGKEYFFKYQNVKHKSSSDKEIKTQYNMLLDDTYGWYLVDKQSALNELKGLRAWHKAI
ncbi:hypothetical protein [Paraglaciecola mesophila]|uniref:hypothetical protein n=1 Tax=Paraglaciecola mesophila TaxID=197222 RepID=UPI001363A7AD|nr:hypothetical protein [Paraglaciecola mesophila]